MIKKIQLLGLIICLAIISWRCSKDDLKLQDITRIGEKSGTFQRPESIKALFESKHLSENSLNKDTAAKIKWIPDWNNPHENKVSDSTTYLFFSLIPQITSKDGTKKNAKIVGRKVFLMVKNGKEFFKASYIPVDSTIRELDLKNFNGDLYLLNLENNKGTSIPYEGGVVAKKYKDLAKKITAKSNKDIITMGWEVECRVVRHDCTFIPESICPPGAMIVFSRGCNYPGTYGNCSAWILSQDDPIVECFDVYIPDVPTDPGNGGSGGNGGGSGGPIYGSNPAIPCNIARDLQLNPDFIAKMKDLVTKTGGDREYGYISQGGNTPYTQVQGEAGADGFDLTVDIQHTKALMHNHYDKPGMLSIFSPDDLSSFFRMAYSDGIPRQDVYMSVVTSRNGGTAYTLTVSDVDALVAWKDTAKDVEALKLLYMYLINAEFSNTKNEAGFLAIIKDHGLTLLKADFNDIKEWGIIDFEGNNGTKITKCN